MTLYGKEFYRGATVLAGCLYVLSILGILLFCMGTIFAPNLAQVDSGEEDEEEEDEDDEGDGEEAGPSHRYPLRDRARVTMQPTPPKDAAPQIVRSFSSLVSTFRERRESLEEQAAPELELCKFFWRASDTDLHQRHCAGSSETSTDLLPISFMEDPLNPTATMLLWNLGQITASPLSLSLQAVQRPASPVLAK